MEYIIALGTGFLAAFFGVIAPSMLNMTAAKMSIERGKFAGIQFSFGAAIVLMIHCTIAVYFAKHLIAHPQIIEQLKQIAIVVFLALAIFFFIQAKKEKNIKGTSKKGHPISIGLGMGTLNMLGIPFYLAMGTLAESKGLIRLEMPISAFFVIGAFIGDFSLFSLYAIFAIKIAEKAKFIAKNINYILCGIFIFLCLYTAYQTIQF